MPRITKTLGSISLVLLVLLQAGAQSPEPPKSTQGVAPASKKADSQSAEAKSSKAASEEVLATVDDEKISRQEVVKALESLQIPAGLEKKAYETAVNGLVDMKILEKYIERHGVKVSESEIDQSVAQFDKQIRQQTNQKQNLESVLAQQKITKADLRDQAKQRLQSDKLFDKSSVKDELRAYYDKNRDLYDQKKIVASHILLKTPPTAGPEEKKKILDRITAIKKEIDSGKIAFADAANKYSEDEGNDDKVGGFLGTIPRRGKFKYEKFLVAAFALKQGSVSDPVETELGYHLIQVTDKINGVEFDFKTNSTNPRFRMEFLKDAIAEERKKHKIDVKPMPSDLFPSVGKEIPPASKGEGGPEAAKKSNKQ